MNEYRGKHVPSQPWAVASSASSSHRARHAVKNKRRRRWVFVILFLCLALIAWPFFEARFVTVERSSLSSEDLSLDIGHLRIVYLSDIHYGFFFSDSDLNGLVSQINQLKPDIVLFGGDYATDNLTAVSFFQKLPSIHARYAILGVIGENDRGDNDFELSNLCEVMRAAGVTPLVNEVSQVRIGSSSVYVAGLDEPLTGKPDLKSLSSKVSASDYVIFMCHNPSVIPDSQLATDSSGRLGWYDLGLFGHTHGGQIKLFSFMSGLLDFADDVPERYRSGWLTENRVDMLVSNGVGTSVMPMRMLCPPQIHYIDISAN